jgi:predicted ribosomally synthesized peptide with nif11-like leader
MSLASLEAFLERVHDDPGLRELLADAPDAGSVAAIARAAGFPVSELDLWQATAASPDDLASAAEAVQPAAEPSRPASDASPLASGREAATATEDATGANPAEAPASGWGQCEQEEQAEPPAANANGKANASGKGSGKGSGSGSGKGKATATAKASPPAPAGRLPDPWWEQEPLTRFVHQAHGDAELRQALATAPDAAAVASIAQAAGHPISEVDLWLASGTTPDELASSLRPPGEEETSQQGTPMQVRPGKEASPGEDTLGEERSRAQWAGSVEAGLLMDDGRAGEQALSPDAGLLEVGPSGADAALLEGGPSSRVGSIATAGPTDAESSAALDRPTESDLTHTAEGPADAEVRLTGDRFPDADASLRQDNPITAAAPCSSGAAWPEETLSVEDNAMVAPTEALNSQAAAEVALREFLRQVEADAELRQALASAPDAVAVASIAQAAGYPISELVLWLASGAAFEEAQAEPEPPSPANDPLTLFLRAVAVDPDLQTALASAPDAATVAAIARIAGFPLTAADLWAASDAVPQELEPERWLVDEVFVEEPERWLVDEVFVEELVVEERLIPGR